MSDSKQAIRVLGGQGTSPDVINSAPAGTEKGWAVWVVNPSAGGGTVDQGKAGTSGESWYVRDGSGLLSTAAKQDAGNSILTSIDGKLTGPLSVTGTISATQGTSPWVVSLASVPLASGAATETKQDSQISLATTSNGSLASLDSKATAGNSSLSTIATQQVDGSQKTQVTSSVLPTGAATAAKQPALGTAGTPSADVLSVQGVVGGAPVPVSGTVTATTSVANFQYITAAGTYPLKTSAGILRYIAITAKFSAGSLSVFNDNNATTNPIAGFDLNVNFFWPLNQVCSNGITVVTGAGFNGQIAVGWD